jgi:hypothetical protein
LTNSTPSNRRLAENEAYFRQYNEQVQKRLKEIDGIAVEEGKTHLTHDESETLFHFYCECSDEDCRKRIALSLNTYTSCHKQRDHFIVLPGHEVRSIERVIAKQPEFWLVEKFIPVPETVDHLNSTNIQNT